MKGGELSDAAVRSAVRCVRLQVYSPDEAEHALRTGHIDRVWAAAGGSGGGTAAADGAMRAGLLRKDAMVAMRTGMNCESSIAEWVEAEGPDQELALGRASADLTAVITAEAEALRGCAAKLRKAHGELTAAVKVE